MGLDSPVIVLRIISGAGWPILMVVAILRVRPKFWESKGGAGVSPRIPLVSPSYQASGTDPHITDNIMIHPAARCQVVITIQMQAGVFHYQALFARFFRKW